MRFTLRIIVKNASWRFFSQGSTNQDYVRRVWVMTRGSLVQASLMILFSLHERFSRLSAPKLGCGPTSVRTSEVLNSEVSRIDKTSTKSLNKTFAHVIEKRSIHELPLNQEIISGWVSESEVSFCLLISYFKWLINEFSFDNLKPPLERNIRFCKYVKRGF